MTSSLHSQATLSGGNYFEPNQESNGFVQDTVLQLYEQGVLKEKSFPFMYMPDKEIFLDEAGASGLYAVSR